MPYAPPIGITASTLGSPPLRELVDAMTKADLRLLSFWPPATYQRARADGWSDRDMRAMNAAVDVEHRDIRVVVSEFLGRLSKDPS